MQATTIHTWRHKSLLFIHQSSIRIHFVLKIFLVCAFNLSLYSFILVFSSSLNYVKVAPKNLIIPQIEKNKLNFKDPMFIPLIITFRSPKLYITNKNQRILTLKINFIKMPPVNSLPNCFYKLHKISIKILKVTK